MSGGDFSSGGTAAIREFEIGFDDQDVISVLISGWPRMGRDLIVAPRRTDGQGITHDGPTTPRVPRRHQDVRPRLVDPRHRHLTPKGPNRNAPVSRSNSAPNTLGESNRGMQSQSIAPSGAINAPVWQFDKKA
jgi:hypothetical protein